MTAFFATLIVLGAGCCVVAVVWARRTRHARKLWKTSRRTDAVAIVLELEDCVRELEQVSTNLVNQQ